MTRALSVRALLEHKPESAVWVTGRVGLIEGDRFALDHDGARVRVRAPQAQAQTIALGAWVCVRGTLSARELLATRVEIVQPALREPSAASSDVLWGQQGGAAMLHARHCALQAIRAFFEREAFIEVETPAVVRSPGLELHLTALEVAGAGERRYLHTSPEYHMKRLLTAGLERIYQLGKAFRQGELGARHEPEFTMLEWYRAFDEADTLMLDTEQLAAHVATALTGKTLVPGMLSGVDLAPPWERLSVHEAFERYAGVSVDSLLPDEEKFYRVLVEQVEPQLGRGKPTFLTRYPAPMAALARLCPDDPSVAERFEAYVDGVELCNGFGELTDPVEQRARLIADQVARRTQGRAVYPIDERFLGALEEGLPPCAGNALGVDRLLMLILGQRRIQDVVAFGNERA